MKPAPAFLVLGLFIALSVHAAEPTRILINQLGYEASGPKQAIVQGTAGDHVAACAVRTFPEQQAVLKMQPKSPVSVDHWRDWQFWSVDFSQVDKPGKYVVTCTNDGAQGQRILTSHPFLIQHNILGRHTLSDVLAFFESERVAGAMNKADADIGFAGKPDKSHIDARGGWYDATGDYGVHFSQLDFTSFFNTQQVPLVVYAMGRSYELLDARDNENFNQLKRRLLAGATYGADFLVRMHPENGSFYESIAAPGPQKKPQDRRIAPVMHTFSLKKSSKDKARLSMIKNSHRYEVSFRSGGGFAIAALAIAARLPWSGHFDQATYLRVAEQAFAYLQKHNKALLNDGKENILDDYSALLAASELLRTTHDAKYRTAAHQRADHLMARLSSDGHYQNYWRRGGPGSGPFFIRRMQVPLSSRC